MAEEITKINHNENFCDLIFLQEEKVPKEEIEEGFAPTHQELIAQTKHWANELLDISWLFDFVSPQYGGDIQGARNFASWRLNRIRKIVGDEEVDKACREVRNDFRKKIGEDLWAVFEHGDEAQRDAAAQEMNSNVTRDKKLLASFTYVTFPESTSPDRTKRISVSLTPKEFANLAGASRRFAKSVGDIVRKGAALYIRAKNAKRKSTRKGGKLRPASM